MTAFHRQGSVYGWALAGLIGFAPLFAHADGPKETVKAGIDFNRQIRPILSDYCFTCHGPDEKQRKANLRLDTKAGAFGKLKRGGHAIVPGKTEQSALVERILSEAPSERMPPPKFTKKLSAEQIELLKRWVAEGAPYEEHWAFEAPKRPTPPPGKFKEWARNPIDQFILARLEKEGMQPSPEADRTTLIRRLYLDLTGLPPTPADVDAFLADKRPKAYEILVDKLLSDPHYGERMALDWLDAARYADTHGFHIDSGRDMTRWREYVIDAFNEDLPFDRFTIEQLAGDLLPGATLRQKVASGFNRNHMINFEGGAIPAEYHNAYIVDRVVTTSTVWLGLTMICAQCHDHKYDPVTQKEFYQLYAFFNNVPENGLDGSKGNAVPMMAAPTKDQELALARLDQEIKKSQEDLLTPRREAAKAAIAKLQKEKAAIQKAIPTTMVMQELPKPRDTFLLMRGEYDKKGEKVKAGVPSFLPAFPKDAPPNRLGLARWLVDPDHPLTSRVTVNRYWQMFFGTGLVKTSEDFGSQAEPPSHPELLDYLAVEFMQPTFSPASKNRPDPWSVKHLVRLIVTSSTYRQSSKLNKDLYARDPENRLLARGPRFRLQAEFIRDQALAISGLLNREIGGKSVSPYQPLGLWEELASRGDSKNWSAQFFELSKGKDLYRRSMYTFWKRTSPPPQMLTFDAPDRETCTVRRARTNTPLQALVLMNDPTYVEASRKLAERLLSEAKSNEERLTLGFRLATARPPSDKELAILQKVLNQQLARYAKDEPAALKLLGVGASPRDERFAAPEAAAWAVVSNVLLNLDEVVTKN